MERKPVKTREEVLAEFDRKGISVRSWAKQNNVSYRTTNTILKGDRGFRFGAGHKIAVLLGLKEGEIMEEGNHE